MQEEVVIGNWELEISRRGRGRYWGGWYVGDRGVWG